MRPLRYSINVTLDGCCDHRAGSPDEETHRHATKTIEQADALILGRVTYEMMESAWRPSETAPEMPDWTAPFARTIDAAKKYVVSSTLDQVDWNAELVRGDPGDAVRELKQQPGKNIVAWGGATFASFLINTGLINEYWLTVNPILLGEGKPLFKDVKVRRDLEFIHSQPLQSGMVTLRYKSK